MAAVTGRSTYVPGKGTTVRSKSGKAKTYEGSGPAPSGTRKVRPKTAATAPTITEHNGEVTFQNVPAKHRSAALVRQARARRRVQRILTASNRQAPKLPPPPARPKQVRPAKAPSLAKQIASQIGGSPSELKKITQAAEQNRKGFIAEGNKPPTSTPPAPKLKGTPQERRQVRGQLRQAKAALRRSKPHIVGDLGPEQRQFIRGVAKKTGLKLRTVAAQARAEEGNGAQTEAEQTHNFLNMGPGIRYSSLPQAIQETAKNYNTNSLYAGVRATRGQSAATQADAIAASPWGTGSLIEQTLPEVAVTPGDPAAQQRYRAAVKKAKSLGMKVGRPTPGTSRGAGNTVYIRADAKGALQFARANLGVTTGSSKELKLAASVGGATDPWCATFVSAVLKRVGIQPPSNPSYSGAFAEDWKGGTNLNTTSLAKAKPGDILIFDWGDGGITDHTAFYAGNGQMIGGNQGPGEVSEESVPAGNVVAIVRPHYKGGKVAVKETTRIPSSFTSSGGVVEAPAGTSLVASPTPVTGSHQRSVKLTKRQQINRAERKLKAINGPAEEPAEPGHHTELERLEHRYGRAVV